MELGNCPYWTVSSGLTKKNNIFAAGWRKICRQDYFVICQIFIVNAVHFLKCIFSLVFYVIMFLSFEGSDEEKIIIMIFFINKSSFLHRDLRSNEIRELPADSFKNMDSLQIL